MEYNIKIVPCVDWGKIEKAPIEHYGWRNDYTPKAYAQLAYLENQGLCCRMTCHEKDPKAVYTKFYEEVWLDSTMEFFFGFEWLSDYINCEMNSIGNSLIGVGEGRDNRKPITDYCDIPKVVATIEEDKWQVEVLFTDEQLKAVFGDIEIKDGTVMYGNLFKVGEHTHTPHYGMWSKISCPEPDFHRPECFGKFIFTK